MQRCEKSIMNSLSCEKSIMKRRKEKRDKGWSIKKTPLDLHLALFHML